MEKDKKMVEEIIYRKLLGISIEDEKASDIAKALSADVYNAIECEDNIIDKALSVTLFNVVNKVYGENIAISQSVLQEILPDWTVEKINKWQRALDYFNEKMKGQKHCGGEIWATEYHVVDNIFEEILTNNINDHNLWLNIDARLFKDDPTEHEMVLMDCIGWDYYTYGEGEEFCRATIHEPEDIVHYADELVLLDEKLEQENQLPVGWTIDKIEKYQNATDYFWSKVKTMSHIKPILSVNDFPSMTNVKECVLHLLEPHTDENIHPYIRVEFDANVPIICRNLVYESAMLSGWCWVEDGYVKDLNGFTTIELNAQRIITFTDFLVNMDNQIHKLLCVEPKMIVC